MTEPLPPTTRKPTLRGRRSSPTPSARRSATTRRSRSSTTTPSWPALYAREEARIRGILGDRVVSIDHAGSTSVPGLAAKPQIDIVLVVADSSDETAYAPDLEAAGYRLVIREPKWFEHRVFKGPDTNINLHTFSPGCQEIDRMLGFRDWLRTHDDDRGSTSRRSASWRRRPGRTSRTTPTPRRRSSRRSSPAPAGRLARD